MSLLGLARANPPGFEASLLAAAEVRPEAVALRTKSRGDWRIWTWRDLLREIDRFSTFLEGRGIGHGTAVALVGEIRPSILFSALAAAAIGAAIVPVAPEATAAEIGALLDRKPIGLAVIQGRRALAAWLQAAAPRPRPVVLVFDHVTPTGKTPEDGVIPLAAVLSVAPARGWDEQLGTAGRSSRAGPALWVEASTAWPEALDVLVDAWLGIGASLALPELLGAAARDRAEIRPDRWIASAEAAAAAAADIGSRWRPTGPASWRRLLLGLARRRLGLSRLTAVEVQGRSPAAQAVFEQLGLAVRPVADDAADEGAGQPRHAFAPRLAVVGGA
jgi:acyl-CoA synthetase (AMP-forming)/AMP-acid ligase II